MSPEGDEDAGGGDALVPPALLVQICRLQVALRFGSNATADSLQLNPKYHLPMVQQDWIPQMNQIEFRGSVCKHLVTYLIHFGEVGPQQGPALPPLICRPLLHEPLQLQGQRPLPPTHTSAAGGHLPVDYLRIAKFVSN